MIRRLQVALFVFLALALSPGGGRAQSADPAGEAAALVAKIMEALGGEAKLKSIRGWRYKGLQTHRDSTGEHLNQIDLLFLIPDRLHIESRTAQGNVTVVYSPAEAFWVSGTNSGNLPSWDHQALMQDLKVHPFNVLQHASEPGYSFRVAGSEVVAGVPARILEVSAPGAQARWYVDPASGWILRTSQSMTTDAGPVERTRDYSNWWWVEGGALPFKQHYNQTGSNAATEGTLEIQSIQINPPTDPQAFSRSPQSLASLAFTPATVSFTPPAPPPPKKAALRISAQPGRAQVYLDDEPRGTASEEGRLVLKDLAPGAYRLRLTLAEYKDWNQTITLNPGDELSVEARLTPQGPAPFTADDIVEMLGGGVSPKRAAALVQQQGVDFALTQAIENRIRAAGGDSDLLLVIAKAKK